MPIDLTAFDLQLAARACGAPNYEPGMGPFSEARMAVLANGSDLQP
jgi:hypothetical protein